MDAGNESMIGIIGKLAMSGVTIFAVLFLVLLGLLVLTIIMFFIIDVTQSKDSVRRNYPVLGRFRHFFSELGEFFRQYFFAMDREEMPFNRAERDWDWVRNRSFWINEKPVTRSRRVCQRHVSKASGRTCRSCAKINR